jgi:hypothetical protein
MRFLRIIIWLQLLAGSVLAQRAPHLSYVYPAGGQVGASFQAVVGGQTLVTISNAFFTGEGIEATVVEINRPMNQKDFNALRDRFRELQEKFQSTWRGNAGTNAWTAADSAERDQLRAKLLKNPPNRTANPAMVDTVTLRICLATNAEPGEHELRLAGQNGLSNPLKFFVGTLPEMSKLAARSMSPELERFLARIGGHTPAAGTPKYEARLSLPAIVNGQIMPGGVDRYRFSASRGQQLVFTVGARQLIPYLADAVPGWFEAVLSLYDSQGKELLTEQRFRFRPDPVVHFEVPSDGEYTLEIHDSIFRGREDFVYRLTAGEEPFVTAIFPLGGQPGEKTTVDLAGWNLAEKTIQFDGTDRDPGLTTLPGRFINTVPFAIDEFPACRERKPNNSAETAQALAMPVIVDGRISAPGQRAVFKFQGRTGEPIVAEVLARRLDSPLDSLLRLTDVSGRQLAINDDFEDKGSGLNTHHADSYLMTSLPAEGTYFLHLSDTQGRGGPDFAYRLRLSEPRPDFALRIVPSSLTVRAGRSVPLTVFALRRDGFTNAINLVLEGAPDGFALGNARIPAGVDKTQLILKAPPQAIERPVALTIAGRASIAGKSVQHIAVPCEDMMQAFAYHHWVPSQQLAVLVR